MDKIRFTAAKIIFDVTEKNFYANVEISKKIREKNFSELDRRFLTELVYGTIKTIFTLDWKISKYISRKIDAKVLTILRMGMYQIIFMDKVPKFAAVNESVEIAKKFCGVGASKFVNGVLREFLRNPKKSEIILNDTPESLALQFFHPTWLVKIFLEEFGLEKTKKILEFNNIEPRLSMRVNLLKTSREEILKKISAEPSKIAAEGIILRKHESLDELELLKKGYLQVQDESSMIIAEKLELEKNLFVIDCCASPGGKSTHIAEKMLNCGKVLACDISEEKIEKILENSRRLGIKIIETLKIDARKIFEKYFESADRVLVDAPCSGLGVIRRKADIRNRKNLEEIKKLPKLQLEILESASKSLKIGGILIYSTCTIIKSENDEVIEKFLMRNKNFEIMEKKLFLPHETGTDGFFYAKMRKNKNIEGGGDFC